MFSGDPLSSSTLISRQKQITNLGFPVFPNLIHHLWVPKSSIVVSTPCHCPVTWFIRNHVARVAPVVHSDGFHMQGSLNKGVKLAYCLWLALKFKESPTWKYYFMQISPQNTIFSFAWWCPTVSLHMRSNNIQYPKIQQHNGECWWCQLHWLQKWRWHQIFVCRVSICVFMIPSVLFTDSNKEWSRPFMTATSLLMQSVLFTDGIKSEVAVEKSDAVNAQRETPFWMQILLPFEWFEEVFGWMKRWATQTNHPLQFIMMFHCVGKPDHVLPKIRLHPVCTTTAVVIF